MLWAFRTTFKIAIGETTFTSVFGHEVVVPAEIGKSTHRTEYFDEKKKMSRCV